MKRNNLFLAIVCLSVLFALTANAGDNTEKILSNLQKKYESLQDITIHFTQDITFGVTQNNERFKGVLIVKKGNKYRVELEHQTIVTDGKSVWSYSITNNQVLIDKFKDDPNSLSPDKVLVNIPDRYTTTLLAKEKNGDQELNVLKLIPKNKNANVQWMKIWVDTDEWVMRKIQLQDLSDNITTYSIDEITYNTGVNDSQFQLQTPAGAQVLDLR